MNVLKSYFTDEFERQKRKELIVLMNDWKKVISKKDKIVFRDDGEAYDSKDYFNTDGFFPGYFSAKKRVLFIGRESRCISGEDRIESDLKNFKDLEPSASSYWRRLLYITYGIRHNGKYKFEEIPNANDILAQMLDSNDFGFAIMNISKYSNDCDDGASADYELINRFLEDSELDKRNFVQEEIELLSPSVIITANLWNGEIKKELINAAFPEKLFSEGIGLQNNEACLYDYRLGKKTIKLRDLFHFSSRKSDAEYFYNPVMKLLFSR